MEYKVSDIMTKNPVKYTVPSSIPEVIHTLIKNNVTGIPIIDNNNKYQGVITRRDIFYNPDETQTALVMRKAKAINQNDSVENAAKELVKQGKRHLIAVNDDNEVTGILTPQNFLNIVNEKYGNTKVKNIIEYNSVCVWKNTPLSVALITMKLSQIFSFPVLDDNAKFIGLITDRDIFDKVKISHTSVLSESGIADDEDPWSWEGIRNVFTYIIEKSNIKVPDIKVKELMVPDPKVIYLESTINDAVKLMLQRNYNQLPVLSGHGEISGMLYDIEILKVFNDKNVQ